MQIGWYRKPQEVLGNSKTELGSRSQIAATVGFKFRAASDKIPV
jgi:hypothetical protein